MEEYSSKKQFRCKDTPHIDLHTPHIEIGWGPPDNSVLGFKDKETFVNWAIIFQLAVSASESPNVDPVPFTLDWPGISSADSPFDSAHRPSFLPPFGSGSQSELSQFTFLFTSLSSPPICVWLLALLVCFLTPLSLTSPFSCLLPFGWLPVCPSLSIFCFFLSLGLFRTEVSAPLYQSVGHSGADQSISGAGALRGEGRNPGSFLEFFADFWAGQGL